MKTKVDQHGFNHILLKIMLYQHPDVFSNRPTIPYPEDKILGGVREDGRLEKRAIVPGRKKSKFHLVTSFDQEVTSEALTLAIYQEDTVLNTLQ